MTIIIVLIIVVVLAILYFVWKKREHQNESNDYARRLEKFKSNEQLKNWARELAEITKEQIEEIKFYGFKLFVMPYTNAVNFGYNLQEVYYERFNQLDDNPKATVLSQFNFTQHNLPDLNSYDNRLDFLAVSSAVADMTAKLLKDFGYDTISVTSEPRIINSKGYKTEYMQAKQMDIPCIVYTPKQGTGNW